MDDAELRRLLANHTTAPEPSAEALRAIVARDRRARRRTIGGVAVVTLAIGAITGGLTSGLPPSAPTQATNLDADLASFESEQMAALEAAARPGHGEGAGPAADRPQPLDQLFLRTTGDGIAVRAYRHLPGERPPCPEGPPCLPSPPAECRPSELLLAELSNSGAIGPRHPLPVFTEATGNTVEVLHAAVFGIRERSPAQWVAILAGPDVATVRVTFADGARDEMAPVDGYAVLARAFELPEASATAEASPLRPRLAGTVEGLEASGTVLTTEDLVPGDTFSRPEGCPPLSGGGRRGGLQRPGPAEEPGTGEQREQGAQPAPGERSGPGTPPRPGERPGPGGARGPGERPGGRQRPGPVAPGDRAQGGGPAVGDGSTPKLAPPPR